MAGIRRSQMSALGQKQTFGAKRHVCFASKSGHYAATCSINAGSSPGAREQRKINVC
jgi:hypothetical protein